MNESSRFVRWLVVIVLTIATAGMVLVSLRANYLFGFGFGQTEEKAQVFGFANVAADLWKVSGLVVVTGLWRAGRKRFALTLLPVWVLCLLWGLVGAVGVYAQDRNALIGGRVAVTENYNDAEREVEEIDGKLKGLTTRTTGQVDAAIAAVLARPVTRGDYVRGTVGKLSNNCTNGNKATADECLEIAKLREERAAAEDRAQLERRKATLRTHITKLREGGGGLAADPVAELFAWLTRGQISVRDVGLGFPLVFAFLIEIVSAFGPMGIVAYAEATRKVNEPSTASVAEVSSGRVGRVVNWMADRTEPTPEAVAITVEELHADYEVWCLGKGLTALSVEAFRDQFDRLREVAELNGKIRKFSNRYYGLRLVDRKVMRLPSRKRNA